MKWLDRIKLCWRILWHGETPPGPRVLDMQHGKRQQSGWDMAMPKSFYVRTRTGLTSYRGVGVCLPNGEYWVMFPHGGGLHRTKRELIEIEGE